MSITFTLLQLLTLASIIAAVFLIVGVIVEYCTAGYLHDRRHQRGHR